MFAMFNAINQQGKYVKGVKQERINVVQATQTNVEESSRKIKTTSSHVNSDRKLKVRTDRYCFFLGGGFALPLHEVVCCKGIILQTLVHKRISMMWKWDVRMGLGGETDKGFGRYEDIPVSLQHGAHVMACFTFSFPVKLSAAHGPTHYRADGNGTLMS